MLLACWCVSKYVDFSFKKYKRDEILQIAYLTEIFSGLIALLAVALPSGLISTEGEHLRDERIYFFCLNVNKVITLFFYNLGL